MPFEEHSDYFQETKVKHPLVTWTLAKEKTLITDLITTK